MAGKDDTTPHEIVHGTEGKPTLEHTQHEAPMPKIEKGDGIDVSSLSSNTHGGSGPTPHDKSSASKSTSKDFTSHTSSAAPTSSGTAGSHGTYAEAVRESAHSEQHEGLTSSTSKEQKKGGKGSLPPSISASDNEPNHSSSGGNKFDEVDRENAEKFGGVNLDNEGKQGSGHSSGGSHEKKSGHDHHDHQDASKKTPSSSSTSNAHEPSHKSSSGNKFEEKDRENAEKFGAVNLSNE